VAAPQLSQAGRARLTGAKLPSYCNHCAAPATLGPQRHFPAEGGVPCPGSIFTTAPMMN
jgi:hypothetical protein